MPDQTLFPHIMLIPSEDCPAQCSYCFGPHRKNTMSEAVLETALDTIGRWVEEKQPDTIPITFHGGEPLTAGLEFFRAALSRIRQQFGSRNLQIKVQSNLWLLNDDFCRLFREHQVGLGTSLDGPQDITDHQRGDSYFAKTMRGINIARQHGLDVGCIATLTEDSATQWKPVMDFFRHEQLSVSLHAAVRALGQEPFVQQVAPDHYARGLVEILEDYIQHQKTIRITTLDQMIQGVHQGTGKVCTFQACLGRFAAIDPQGGIYSCQRFCGHPEYQLGHVDERRGWDALFQSPAGRRLQARASAQVEACRGCDHWNYCKGGCLYNSATEGGQRDPLCPAYSRTFSAIRQHLIQEMQTVEGIRSLASEKSVLSADRKTILSLMDEQTHPSRIARHAKRVAAAVALARGSSPSEIAASFVRQGWSVNAEAVRESVEDLQKHIRLAGTQRNNLYIHITNACQLTCSHCYANAKQEPHAQSSMQPDQVFSLVRQAARAGFRQSVITGGEPLLHPGFKDLCKELSTVNAEIRPHRLILRSNFAVDMEDTIFPLLARGFEQIVVSVDGDEQMHDQRRGKGSYAKTISNCRRYLMAASGISQAAELSLAAVLCADEHAEAAIRAVALLGKTLGVRRTRIRPLLPLGRAQQRHAPPAAHSVFSGMDAEATLIKGMMPAGNCGLGQNLYLAPDGQAFPCYAHHAERDCLGTVFPEGLQPILDSREFSKWQDRHVDDHPLCRDCDFRYLCGGMCQAWMKSGADCGGVKQYAEILYAVALRFLGAAQPVNT